MIKLRNVKKIYKNSNNELVALDDVSYDFKEQGLFFILGKSGSGKSTLLHLIAGVIGDYSGELNINNEDLSAFTEDKWDSFRNQNIGIVFQNFNLIEEFSVYENVLMPLKILTKDKEEKAQKVKEVLEFVGLSDFTQHKVSRLSGGQKQRVAIARALVKEPKILLADEPTGNLDQKNAEEIYKLLKKISQSCLTCIVSHDTRAAEIYADEIVVLEDGKIIENKKKIIF